MRLNTARLEMLSLLDSLGTVRAVAAALCMSPSAVSAQLAVDGRYRVAARTALTAGSGLQFRHGSRLEEC